MNINPNAKRILIYGDSLTWGRIANTPYRYDISIRYTGVLQRELGSKYEVIEEGLRGRMAHDENPYLENKNGWIQFVPIYLSQLPIDVLVIFLGTNDTNTKSNKNSVSIAEDVSKYIGKAKELSKEQEMHEPAILLIAPPLVDEGVLKLSTMFSGAYDKMRNLPSLLENIAKENNCYFFDPNKYIKVCKEDGVHLNKEANIILGKELANFIKTLN